MAVIDNTVTEACHVTRRAKMADKTFDKGVIDDAIKAGTISLGYQELKEDQTHVIEPSTRATRDYGRSSRDITRYQLNNY